MSIHIRLPGASGVTGGVEFIDGSAIVEALGPNARAFFQHAGATITEDVTVLEGSPLEDLTMPELRDMAQELAVTVRSRASKSELIAAIETADVPVLSVSPDDPVV